MATVDESEKVETPEERKPAEKAKPLDLGDPRSLLQLVYSAKDLDDIKPQIIAHLNKIITNSKLDKSYRIIFLFDPKGAIGEYTANQIYQAISQDPKKDLLLMVVSKGGSIESAYLIGKICKHYANKFVITIPRKAKSAATLLALGADEIHMGVMSELGPIDPQIKGLPALGLSNAVDYLAGLCEKYPKSGSMLARYLGEVLDLQTLGYFQRVSESEVHYAEQLLESKKLPEGMTAKGVADRLVNHYKDHSFVIDKDEASKYLGECIKTDTPEFKLSDDLHKFLVDLHLYIEVFKKKDLTIIGNLEKGLLFSDVTN